MGSILGSIPIGNVIVLPYYSYTNLGSVSVSMCVPTS